jgi:hypothetical protein
MKTAKGEHLVLVGPGGKRAGHKNQSMIALQLYAMDINPSGTESGISSLLLPRTAHESSRLKKLGNRGYSIKKVVKRPNIRHQVRDAVSASLLVTLAENYLSEKGASQRALSAFIRELTDWITNKLKEHKPNKVQSIVANAHPELVHRTSSDWWKKQIAHRKKK